jgi:hypothetical protein
MLKEERGKREERKKKREYRKTTSSAIPNSNVTRS